MIGKVVYKSRLKYYHFSSKIKTQLNLGRLPDFLIVGTQKGGTTSVFELLRHHPDVKLPFQKELHFFNDNFEAASSSYKAHFPIQFPFLQPKITGESTPHYLFDQETPQRVKSLIPKAKIIILLRNPVGRAFSHYKHNLRVPGRENLSFTDAIKQEEHRTSLSLQNLKHYSYIQRGMYFSQLQRWMKHFDRKDILILRSEDFFVNTALVWKELLSFLELPDFPLPKNQVFNKTTGGSKMEESIKEELYSYFESPNQKLYNLLERDFDWSNKGNSEVT